MLSVCLPNQRQTIPQPQEKLVKEGQVLVATGLQETLKAFVQYLLLVLTDKLFLQTEHERFSGGLVEVVEEAIVLLYQPSVHVSQVIRELQCVCVCAHPCVCD